MLVPELAEASVNEQQPEGVTLSGLLEGMPAAWGGRLDEIVRLPNSRKNPR
jgi:hypothetical protein